MGLCRFPLFAVFFLLLLLQQGETFRPRDEVRGTRGIVPVEKHRVLKTYKDNQETPLPDDDDDEQPVAPAPGGTPVDPPIATPVDPPVTDADGGDDGVGDPSVSPPEVPAPAPGPAPSGGGDPAAETPVPVAAVPVVPSPEDSSGGDTPDGDTSSGNEPGGETTDGETTDGDASGADTNGEDAPDGGETVSEPAPSDGGETSGENEAVPEPAPTDAAPVPVPATEVPQPVPDASGETPDGDASGGDGSGGTDTVGDEAVPDPDTGGTGAATDEGSVPVPAPATDAPQPVSDETEPADPAVPADTPGVPPGTQPPPAESPVGGVVQLHDFTVSVQATDDATEDEEVVVSEVTSSLEDYLQRGLEATYSDTTTIASVDLVPTPGEDTVLLLAPGSEPTEVSYKATVTYEGGTPPRDEAFRAAQRGLLGNAEELDRTLEGENYQVSMVPIDANAVIPPPAPSPDSDGSEPSSSDRSTVQLLDFTMGVDSGEEEMSVTEVTRSMEEHLQSSLAETYGGSVVGVSLVPAQADDDAGAITYTGEVYFEGNTVPTTDDVQTTQRGILENTDEINSALEGTGASVSYVVVGTESTGGSSSGGDTLPLAKFVIEVLAVNATSGGVVSTAEVTTVLEDYFRAGLRSNDDESTASSVNLIPDETSTDQVTLLDSSTTIVYTGNVQFQSGGAPTLEERHADQRQLLENKEDLNRALQGTGLMVTSAELVVADESTSTTTTSDQPGNEQSGNPNEMELAPFSLSLYADSTVSVATVTENLEDYLEAGLSSEYRYDVATVSLTSSDGDRMLQPAQDGNATAVQWTGQVLFQGNSTPDDQAELHFIQRELLLDFEGLDAAFEGSNVSIATVSVDDDIDSSVAGTLRSTGDDDGVSGGTIAWAVAGSVVLCSACCLGVLCAKRRRRNDEEGEGSARSLL